MDWRIIYEMVEDNCFNDNGCPSHEPVILSKPPVLHHIFGIRRMQQNDSGDQGNLNSMLFFTLVYVASHCHCLKAVLNDEKKAPRQNKTL